MLRDVVLVSCVQHNHIGSRIGLDLSAVAVILLLLRAESDGGEHGFDIRLIVRLQREMLGPAAQFYVDTGVDLLLAGFVRHAELLLGQRQQVILSPYESHDFPSLLERAAHAGDISAGGRAALHSDAEVERCAVYRGLILEHDVGAALDLRGDVLPHRAGVLRVVGCLDLVDRAGRDLPHDRHDRRRDVAGHRQRRLPCGRLS